jgi:AcrR family transcriptional regulator
VPPARRPAAERREEVVEIAFRHFAEGGYHGTSTEAIAREAGISQPYLFRLFKTKRELFVACTERCYTGVWKVFQEAAEGLPVEERLMAMGHAYEERLLPDRYALRFQMQAYAVASDPQFKEAVREGYGQLVRNVAELAGVPLSETWDFFAYGMLLNLVAAFDLREIVGQDEWATAWAEREEMHD